MLKKIIFIGFCMQVGLAMAHVTLEQASAPVNDMYKAVLRVGHGCDGSPTTGLRVQLPPGFQGAKPMPKPGWTVTTRSEKLAKPYETHGRLVTEEVVEIQWNANQRDAWLADAHYDEFIVRGRLPNTAGAIWFKVLQTCEKGQLDWSQIPSAGSDTQGLKTPAARLEVEPLQQKPVSKSHAHHH
jgi:uncharacterized protein YcnI